MRKQPDVVAVDWAGKMPILRCSLDDRDWLLRSWLMPKKIAITSVTAEYDNFLQDGGHLASKLVRVVRWICMES